jgi:predicted ATPase
VLAELNRRLGLIDSFSGFEIPADLGPGEHRLSIRDRYLPDILLDQRSANEGFLFLLFYYTLLLSPDTPRFFAIDNIDASLNPRLCARLMSDVVELAKQQDRQGVVTTHNPAVLDGLDLTDDAQRLVVVSRAQKGATRVRRVRAPEPIEGAPPLRLSEAFIQGFLGGLPSNF